MVDALFHTAAIGYLMMRNASVAGAEAGCQAEVGAASAMAAAAVTELMGGTPQMCLQAAAMAISNLLGLVCDPVAGLVEVPCQSQECGWCGQCRDLCGDHTERRGIPDSV